MDAYAGLNAQAFERAAGSDRGAVFLGVTILVEGRPRRGMRPVS